MTPVDAFVVAAWQREGIPPGVAADRRTLLRRLSLDLVGLPPKEEDIEGFLQDAGPFAYERQVERLLASPHFGERQALAWLEAAGFSDMAGDSGTPDPRLFPYRDYVIRSFNDNTPFDRFTLEQLAGDLLKGPTAAQRVASGFHYLNLNESPGGASLAEDREARYRAERVRVVSSLWLGVTMACAECHDHPSDPFTTGDFRAMAAFFSDLTPCPDDRAARGSGAAGPGDTETCPPTIEVDIPYLRKRLARLAEEEVRLWDEASRRLLEGPQANRDAFRRWRHEVDGFLGEHPDGWRVPRVLSFETTGDGELPSPAEDRAVTQADGSVQVSVMEVTADEVALELGEGWVAAVRLELMPALPSGTLLRGGQRAATVRWQAWRQRSGAASREPLPFWWAEAEAWEPRHAGGNALPGILEGWTVTANPRVGRHVAIGALDRPFRAAAGDRLILRFPGNPMARWRLAVSPLGPDRARWATMVTGVWNALGQGRGLWESRAHAAFHRSTAWDAELTRRWRRLDREIRDCRGGRARAVVVAANRPSVGGGPVGEPGVPAVFTGVRDSGGGAVGMPRGTRLELAHWLTSAGHPLTARHVVNRLWAQHFGRGLTARPGDLGISGGRPTHPELLDWLAAEFMRPTLVASPVPGVAPPEAWDYRHLVRLLVNSATYRRSAAPPGPGSERDPENRSFGTRTSRAVDAAFVHDSVLSLSGLLDPDIGGPSVFPGAFAFGDARPGVPGGPGLAPAEGGRWRRSLYLPWQRTAEPLPSVEHDPPLREACAAMRRVLSTRGRPWIPDEDRVLDEAGRVLAERWLRQPGDEATRLRGLLRAVFQREPLPGEMASWEERLASPTRARGFEPLPAGLAAGRWEAWVEVARAALMLEATRMRD